MREERLRSKEEKRKWDEDVTEQQRRCRSEEKKGTGEVKVQKSRWRNDRKRGEVKEAKEFNVGLKQQKRR